MKTPSPTEYWGGNMADFQLSRFFCISEDEAALSTTEITQNYNALKTRFGL